MANYKKMAQNVLKPSKQEHSSEMNHFEWFKWIDSSFSVTKFQNKKMKSHSVKRSNTPRISTNFHEHFHFFKFRIMKIREMEVVSFSRNLMLFLMIRQTFPT